MARACVVQMLHFKRTFGRNYPEDGCQLQKAEALLVLLTIVQLVSVTAGGTQQRYDNSIKLEWNTINSVA